jgi:hypothetical protein
VGAKPLPFNGISLSRRYRMKLFEALRRSTASQAFHDAVESFVATASPNERISFPSRTPPIKVERTLVKILESFSTLPIESVEIDARSGCEYFRGEARVRASGDERRVRFDWDCRWKAVQLGWTDYFGFPDQARAAREFGHECFRGWQELPVQLVADA